MTDKQAIKAIAKAKEDERRRVISSIALILADITDCGSCPISKECNADIIPPCHHTWKDYLRDKIREREEM